jgi:cytochrome c oxidase subunit III
VSDGTSTASGAAAAEEVHPAPLGSPQFHHAHHFDSPTTQFDSGRLGIWIFLVTEILFFGGMFCAFAVFRSWYFDAFKEAHHHLNKVLGATNTMVLIASSLTMALGVRFAQKSNKKVTVLMLALTIAFACTFLVIKYFEYAHKFHEGLLPGAAFTAEGFKTGKDAGMFFACYFMMTGVHGVHVIVGIGLITWILVRAIKGQFSSRYYAPVEGVGLYWHLVDMIWIYLFPLLYLVG